jgi:methylamine dehydrogenase accessory protein MauD
VGNERPSRADEPGTTTAWFDLGTRSRQTRRVDGWWTASYVVLWCLVVVLCIVVVALARQIGTLHLRLGPRGALEIDDEGPPLGESPQPLEGMDRAGGRVAIGGPGRRQLILFVSPTCRVCDAVLPAVPVVARAGGLSPLIVTDSTEGLEMVLDKSIGVRVVSAPAAASAFSVPGTPYAVFLDDSGTVRAKGTVNNLEQLEGLADTAARRIREFDDHRRAG